MKSLGRFEEFKNYEDFQARKLGTKPLKEKFENTLPPKEREQYLEMFGEDEN